MKIPSVKMKKILLGLIAVFLFAVVTGAFILLSPAGLPAPQGPYRVGTRSYEWTDQSRSEPANGSPRRLLVQVWYPADQPVGQPMPFHPSPSGVHRDFSELYGLPGWFTDRLLSAQTHAYPEASLSERQAAYPVLVFSHGFNGTRFQNATMMEEAASRGYVVFSIEHTYTAAGTVFSDGREGGIVPFLDLRNDSIADYWLQTWSQDQIFAIDRIEELQQSDEFFSGRLDLDKLGLFGHSFGGNAAANTLTLDRRVKAGINMDGFYFGSFHGRTFEQPFLELRAPWKPLDSWTEEDYEQFEMTPEYARFLLTEWDGRIGAAAANGFERIEFEGADHMTFSDFPFLFPLRSITAPDFDRFRREINEAVIGFFFVKLGV